jgi:hypothetical protein
MVRVSTKKDRQKLKPAPAICKTGKQKHREQLQRTRAELMKTQTYLSAIDQIFLVKDKEGWKVDEKQKGTVISKKKNRPIGILIGVYDYMDGAGNRDKNHAVSAVLTHDRLYFFNAHGNARNEVKDMQIINKIKRYYQIDSYVQYSGENLQRFNKFGICTFFASRFLQLFRVKQGEELSYQEYNKRVFSMMFANKTKTKREAEKIRRLETDVLPEQKKVKELQVKEREKRKRIYSNTKSYLNRMYKNYNNMTVQMSLTYNNMYNTYMHEMKKGNKDYLINENFHKIAIAHKRKLKKMC